MSAPQPGAGRRRTASTVATQIRSSCAVQARLLWCLSLLFLFGARAEGAELFYMDHDLMTGKYVGPVGPLVISGDIDPGDYDRLLAKILDDENRFLSQNKIIVASSGGDVSEAIKIALFVQALYSEVTVGPQTGPCVAACFLIYAAADRRATDGERLIGLHRPALIDRLANSLPPAQAAALEERAMTQVRTFLAANDVPGDLLAEMFHRSSHEVYWLSEHDEQRLGFKSVAFLRYLKAHCAWDEALEKDVYAGKRPFSDLTQAAACRDRVTQADARKTLDQARKERAAQGGAVPSKSKARR